MAPSTEVPRDLSPDDALPPVEPPSAGFILQLFVVPAIIVMIIVTIWWMFNWLAHRDNDPQDYVRALRRDNEARWQAAVNLANALQSDRGRGERSMKFDTTLAADLSRILEDELKEGSLEEGPITLRVYLCRALGEFAVPDGLPVLVKAAATERNSHENEVRRAALQAIALLHENMKSHARSGPPRKFTDLQLDAVLHKAARDSDSLVRSAAAYTLGVLGRDSDKAELRRMVSDTYPDVRFNAATGLARHGDPAATDVLLEMLDPDERAGVNIEKQREAQDYKRAMIQMNALEAVSQMVSKRPQEDYGQIEQAISQLLKSHVASTVSVKASSVLAQLKRRPARVESSAGHKVRST